VDKETSIVALLKTKTEKKITIGEKPSNATNCIVISKISSRQYRSTTAPLGISKDRYQMDVWGSSFVEAKALADIVKLALDCKKLANFDIVYLENDVWIKDVETGLFRFILEFFVW
jgi:hypothetical protein